MTSSIAPDGPRAPDRGSPRPPSPLSGTKAALTGAVAEYVGWGPRGFRLTVGDKVVFIPKDKLSAAQLAIVETAAKAGQSIYVEGTYNDLGYVIPKLVRLA